MRLAEYHQVFKGNMMFGRVLKAANINWKDLPTLSKCVDDKGRNMICLNYFVGSVHTNLVAFGKVMLGTIRSL
jgi:hypothetical protein